LTITQTADQKLLGTASLNYGYTLACTKAECVASTGFDVKVDIIGVDPAFEPDDTLVAGVNGHSVTCPGPSGAGAGPRPVVVNRTFEIATSKLNEDSTRADEIKLVVNADNIAGGGTVTGETPVVSGSW
jgi:hypothetical protein